MSLKKNYKLSKIRPLIQQSYIKSNKGVKEGAANNITKHQAAPLRTKKQKKKKEKKILYNEKGRKHIDTRK